MATSRAVAGLCFATMVIGQSACNAGTTRPMFRPLPAAVIDTIQAVPDEAVRALTDQIEAAGVPARRVSAQDGYIETRPFDTERGEPGRGTPAHPEASVVFRFWVDAIPGDRSRVTAEAVYRTTVDPSLDPRLASAMAPADHRGFQILRAVLDGAKSNVAVR